MTARPVSSWQFHLLSSRIHDIYSLSVEWKFDVLNIENCIEFESLNIVFIDSIHKITIVTYTNTAHIIFKPTYYYPSIKSSRA